MEAIAGVFGFMRALVGDAESFYLIAGEQRGADRASRPNLYQAGGHELRAYPLVKLADGENQTAMFMKESWGPGEVVPANPTKLKII
jgi:hypothetical protein